VLVRITNKRDFFGGLIIAAFGLVGIFEGYRLGAGTLSKMGAGFVPLSLGFILVGLGLVMVANHGDPDQASEFEFDQPEWRGWLCIVAGVTSFIVLGRYAGLVPAAFLSVFISAMGDRTATVKAAILLSISTTVFGIVLFHYLLSISIPLFWW
jgi:putative tricarboxylic transport membrane protein